MKVIEKREPFSWLESCTGLGYGGAGCGSTLEIVSEDISFEKRSDYLGEYEFYYSFECPVCGRRSIIASNKIPQAIKEDVGKRELRLKRR